MAWFRTKLFSCTWGRSHTDVNGTSQNLFLLAAIDKHQTSESITMT